MARDGSQRYAAIISAANSQAVQVSDRFHPMQALRRSAVEPIRRLLGQKKDRMPYPYPTEEEAFRSIVGDIWRMGQKRHRERVALYYDVRRLKDEGKSIAETARLLEVKPRKVRMALDMDIRKLLSLEQRQALSAARDVARAVSSGRTRRQAFSNALAATCRAGCFAGARGASLPSTGHCARMSAGITWP